MEQKALLELVISTLEDIKALDILTIDLMGESSLADFIVVCSATSTAHAQGIHDRLHFVLKEKGLYPLGVEGAQEGDWILMDYNDIIVHIFLEDLREEYAIEDLHKKAQLRRVL